MQLGELRKAGAPRAGRRHTGGSLVKLAWQADDPARVTVTTRNGTQHWSKADAQEVLEFLQAFLACPASQPDASGDTRETRG
jgi:hypothetical protein